jgi:Ca-activated chloride channel homolog
MKGDGDLSLDLSLSRPAVLPHIAGDEPLFVLLRVRCSGGQAYSVERSAYPAKSTAGPPLSDTEYGIRTTPERLNARTPEHLALVLDASGSMHRIVLEGWERDHWRRVGEERGDLKRGRIDGREGWLWSGLTLAELQSQHRTPMQAALSALSRVGERLGPEDALTVIAFADRARRLVAADAVDRAGQIRTAVDVLSRGVESSGLGDGTRLAEGLRLALEEATGDRRQATGDRRQERLPDAIDPAGLSPARLLLISDGLLEDRLACGAWVERFAEAGLPISCIGVGDQFDEEWLMWAADTTRGWFRYAPTADALEAAVAEELDRLETLAARRLSLRLRPLNGASFRDLCQVSPDLSALQRMETDGAAYRFSLGDLSRGQDALFLAELSLPALAPGRHPVLGIELTAASASGEPLAPSAAEAVVLATGDLTGAAVDPVDLEAIAAVHAYRAERRAQRALRCGRPGEATRHLRDTRQIVERLGRPELAAELDAQAAALEAGARLSAEREKRIKAGTRRLLE